jgi:hypothetical protein
MRKRIKMLKSANMLILALLVLLSGCGEEVVIKRMKPQQIAADETKEVEDISSELAQFTPPFPQSVALFEPEKPSSRQKPSQDKSAVTTDDGSSDVQPEIELVGFGAVDAQHALLMIDGRLEALRVGEHYRNVHVLEITTSSVRLRVAGRILEAKLVTEQDG